MQVKGTGSMCVLVEHVKDNYYARFIILAIIAFSILHSDIKFLQSMEREMCVKGTGSMCVLSVEHVKDNYYARYHNPSHH